MTTFPKFWKFTTLPEEALSALCSAHIALDVKNYREKRNTSTSISEVGLFALDKAPEKPVVKVSSKPIILATDSYSETRKLSFKTKITPNFLKQGIIKPRVEKSQAEQKFRVKAKAEVFTPVWVCNLQNNLIDDEVVGAGAFNNISKDNQKEWTPSTSPVVFPDGYSWANYVASRRLEMAAGEGPYLMSPYDATTGVYMPVRNEAGRFQRIGLLDRKLRVVTENVATLEEWEVAAKIALKSTYGYEWQGDNLVLARLNMVNTYFDYLVDFVAHVNGSKFLEDGFLKERVTEIAEIASWQLWQMDGLKQVVPDSCTEACEACKKKTRSNHAGLLPVIKWGSTHLPFEDFLPSPVG